MTKTPATSMQATFRSVTKNAYDNVNTAQRHYDMTRQDKTKKNDKVDPTCLI